MSKSKPCLLCGQQLHNVFDAVDNVTLYGEDYFNPSIILPSGFKVQIGTLLRSLWRVADDPDQVRDMCESSYGMLWLAETNPQMMESVIMELFTEENES